MYDSNYEIDSLIKEIGYLQAELYRGKEEIEFWKSRYENAERYINELKKEFKKGD